MKKCLFLAILLHDHLRDVPWEDIFEHSAFSAASEFCEWLQVGIDEIVGILCIPHCGDSYGVDWDNSCADKSTNRTNLLDLK